MTVVTKKCYYSNNPKFILSLFYSSSVFIGILVLCNCFNIGQCSKEKRSIQGQIEKLSRKLGISEAKIWDQWWQFQSASKFKTY